MDGNEYTLIDVLEDYDKRIFESQRYIRDCERMDAPTNAMRERKRLSRLEQLRAVVAGLTQTPPDSGPALEDEISNGPIPF